MSQEHTQEMIQYCIKMAKAHGFKFLFKDRDMSYEEVFSPRGLFPALAKRADQLCSLCLGYGVGATFADDEQSTLGMSVGFDNLTPLPIRLLCLLDVLLELAHVSQSNGKVVLDELLYD